jgi:hypothetical protein
VNVAIPDRWVVLKSLYLSMEVMALEEEIFYISTRRKESSYECDTFMIRDFSSLDGMQRRIEPHTFPVVRPIATMMNEMRRESARSMICRDGRPRRGINMMTMQDARVR